MRVTLERFAWTPMGTFGRLRTDRSECFTVELPWADNAPNLSCIPTGIYQLVLGMYYGGDGPGGRQDYPAYVIVGVPDRSQDEIKIHIANLASQLRACIALGRALGWPQVSGHAPAWGVLDSHTAFDEFMAAMSGVRHAELVVQNLVPPTVAA